MLQTCVSKSGKAGKFELSHAFAKHTGLTSEALHHFTRLRVLFQQIVYIVNRRAATFSDAAAAGPINNHVIPAFFGRHGIDDADNFIEIFFGVVELGVLEFLEHADLGHHVEEAGEGAEFADLFDLIAEVFEGEIVAEQFLLHLFGVFHVDVLLHLIDERKNITHAEDAGGDAVGMEGFEGVTFLADADKFEGLAGDGADGEGGAATRIAIHFGEDDAGDAEAFVEFVGGFDGVLASHGVGDEEDFGGVESVLEFGELLHELFVNVLAAGGVDEDDVAAGLHGFAAGGFGEIQRLGLFSGAFVDRRVELLGENAELVAGGGAVDVNRNELGFVAFLRKEARELGGGGGFTGALEADDEDDGGRFVGEAEAGLVCAEHFGELVAHDFDDLLRRGEGGEDVFAHRFDFDVFDELLYDFEVDVGFEERYADFAQGFFHVGGGESAFATHVFEDALELVGKIIEHGRLGRACEREACGNAPLLTSRDLFTLFSLAHCWEEFFVVVWKHASSLHAGAGSATGGVS